jgi:formylglycine-generating enzyme required for sulfatase activity
VLASGVALLFAVTGLSGQEFLGTIEQKVRHMPNTYLWNEVHNRHLRMTRDPNDTSISALDPDRLDAMRKYAALPDLKLKDCVLFKPYESYVGYDPLDQEDSPSRPLFVLDRTYGRDKVFRRDMNAEDLVLPTSIRSCLDTADVDVVPGQLHLQIAGDAELPANDHLRPFYFRKYEVTNKEYRVFVQWVRDSIARNMLFEAGFVSFGERAPSGGVFLDWSTPIQWYDERQKEVLSHLYIDEQTRFYRRREIDPRKLNYAFTPSDEPMVSRVLNVYPDTVIWVQDFKWSFNEPMVENYFWHPLYDDHPVVGVTYLHWRTKMGQQVMDREGMRLRVVYDLPTEIQWDMASTSEMEDERPRTFGKNYPFLTDPDWITDLSVVPHPIERVDSVVRNTTYTSSRSDGLFDLLNSDVSFEGVLVMDGTFHTTKSNIGLIEKKDRHPLVAMQKSPTGICYLGGNVSEWLKDPYTKWKPVFELRQQQLATFQEDDIRILSAIERYWDRMNDADGRLVRGANWYDERFSSRLGVNTAGMNAKVFVSPDRAHSTLGFRYVVYVEPK